MLSVQSPDATYNRGYIRIGCAVDTSANTWHDDTYLSDAELASGDHRPLYDSVDWHLPHLVWDFDVVDWRLAAGLIPRSDSPLEKRYGLVPQQGMYRRDDDIQRYGSRIGLAARFLTGQFVLPDETSHLGKNEKPVDHYSVHGKLTTLGDEFWNGVEARRATWTASIGNYAIGTMYENETHSVTLTSGEPNVAGYQSGIWGGRPCTSVACMFVPELLEVAPTIDQPYLTQVGSDYGSLWLRRAWTDWFYSTDEAGRVTKFSYDYHLWRNSGNHLNPFPQQYQRWRREFVITYRPLDIAYSEAPIEAGMTYPLFPITRVDIETHATRVEGVWEPDNTTSEAMDMEWSNEYFCAKSPIMTNHLIQLQGTTADPIEAMSALMDTNPTNVIGNTTEHDKLLHRAKAVHDFHELPHLRASAAFSAAEAVDSVMDVIQTNHLETLAELDEWSRTVSLIPEVVRLITSLGSQSPIRTIYAVLDMLAEIKLAWSFGVSPTIDSVDELLRKGASLADKVSAGFSGVYTGNGKLITQLDMDLMHPVLQQCFSEAVLVTRTKVRVGISDNALLQALLGVRSVGLLPGLSASWDLIPFSFAIDWFQRIGASLGAMDTHALALLLDLNHVVHSYTVYYKIKPELLENAGLSVAPGSDDPYVKCYSREVSLLTPHNIDTKHNFMDGDFPRDTALVGAFLMKLL